jgi:hypothetical protein
MVNLALLRESGWFAESVEVHSGSATGTGSMAYSVRTPLSDLLAREAAEEGEADFHEQRMRWMVEGAMLIIREAVGKGPRVDVVDVGLTVCTWAWDVGLPPFDEMSQGDVAELAAQGRAAICERHKIKAERKKEAVGLTATKSLRQKTASQVEVSRERATGNKNRARKGIAEELKRLG